MKTLLPAACCALIAAVTVAAGTGAEFRAGAATVKITPPKGAPLAGYYYNRAAEGVHDDLYAKAIVLQQDTNKVAFVVCDLISLTRPIVEEARKIISESSGLKGDHVMMSATHTHTAPFSAAGLHATPPRAATKTSLRVTQRNCRSLSPKVCAWRSRILRTRPRSQVGVASKISVSIAASSCATEPWDGTPAN
jgi:hypothetical protein